MSKNMTRKGLAFGAMVALGSTLLAGAPASADANGPITLLPNGGTKTNATFTSISGAGITLDSVLNPTLAADAAAASAPDRAIYIIENPGGAKITLTVGTNSATQVNIGYLLYNDLGNAARQAGNAGTATLTQSTDFTMSTADFNCGDGTTAAACTSTNLGGMSTSVPYVDYTAFSSGVNATTYVTNATKIAIGAAIEGGAAAKDTIASLKIDTSSTSAVSLKVQVVTDFSTTGNAADYVGKVNSFEYTSAKETISLLPIGSVSASTTITKLARTALDPGTAADVNTQAERDEFGFQATVIYGSSVNPHAVAASTYVQLRQDGGSPLFLNAEDGDTTALGAQVNKFGFSAASKLVSTIHYKTMSATATAPTTTDQGGLRGFSAGVYAAQAYFSTDSGTTLVAVGAASPVVDLNNGLVASITTTDAYMVESANVDYNTSTDVGAVRTGTKSIAVVAKSNVADKSGQRFRAIVTANKLSATSTTAVSGTASTLKAADDEVTAYATSDSTGKVTFTLTNAVGAKDDKVTLAVSTLKADGTWTTANTVVITWANAALSKFAPSPGNYISGANPTLVFKATDQFGQPISTTATGRLSVTVVAKIGGVEDKTKLSETKTVENGQASFTFANFATAAIPAQVEAKLYEGTTLSTVTGATTTVNVYNTSATDKVTVLDSYTADITYVDYVVGDETVADVAAKIELTGIVNAAHAVITGSVQDANAVGLPGAEVVVSSTGVLFYDAAQGIYAQDKITVYANEYGTYSVKAISHKVAPAGQTVTLTSGGKSATTLLKTYFPVNVLNANNLNLTWDLPALMVKNTTYALTATLTDKWGNPVQTVGTDGSIWFTGTGAVQVNGIETAVKKNFDKNGKATVFVRSIKDIAGPGSINAELKIEANQYAVDPAAAVGANGAESAGFDRFTSLTSVVTDVKSTAWDETKFSAALSAVVDIKDSAPASAGEVAIGSFNGRVAVRVEGLQGSRLSVKVGTRWYVVASVPTNRYVWSIPSRKGAVVKVDAYINGDLENTSTITVK